MNNDSFEFAVMPIEASKLVESEPGRRQLLDEIFADYNFKPARLQEVRLLFSLPRDRSRKDEYLKFFVIEMLKH